MSKYRKVWPYTTPSGHTYHAPTTYEEFKARHADAAQGFVECWDNAELPPEPTWEMVGLAHQEIEKLRAENKHLRAALKKIAHFADPGVLPAHDSWRIARAALKVPDIMASLQVSLDKANLLRAEARIAELEAEIERMTGLLVTGEAQTGWAYEREVLKEKAQVLREAAEGVIGGGDEHLILRHFAPAHDCIDESGKPQITYSTCPGCWFEELCDGLRELTEALAKVDGKEASDGE